jgi:hypothetical protein
MKVTFFFWNFFFFGKGGWKKKFSIKKKEKMAVVWDDVLDTFSELKTKWQKIKNSSSTPPSFVMIGYDGCPYSGIAQKALSESPQLQSNDFMIYLFPRYSRNSQMNQSLGKSSQSPYRGSFPMVFYEQKYLGGSDHLTEFLLTFKKPSSSSSLSNQKEKGKDQKEKEKENDESTILHYFPVLKDHQHRDLWMVGTMDNPYFIQLRDWIEQFHQSHPRFHMSSLTCTISLDKFRHLFGEDIIMMIRTPSGKHEMMTYDESYNELETQFRYEIALRRFLKNISQ